jgi:hypothetical protein
MEHPTLGFVERRGSFDDVRERGAIRAEQPRDVLELLGGEIEVLAKRDRAVDHEGLMALDDGGLERGA